MAKDRVVVTGFGPFGEHIINASWEAVKLLPEKGLENIEIIVKEIPVAYDDVDTKICEIWAKYQPKLVIHVGVSSIAKLITIENKAHRRGYWKIDCTGNPHPTGDACPKNEGDDTIICQINVEDICKYVNEINKKTVACISNDAGRYLCEYIYYKSLNMDNRRTLFVHVPPLNSPFSAEELSDIILQIIDICLLQLNCLCTKD